MKAIEYLKSDSCPNIKDGFKLNAIEISIIATIIEDYHETKVNSVINKNIEEINKNKAMLGDVKYERLRALDVIRKKLLNKI